MKIKSLLQLVVIMLAGQFLFSCSTAEYYRFAAARPDYYNKVQTKASPSVELESTSAVPMLATAAQSVATSDKTEPILEASADALTPVLFEKQPKKAIVSTNLVKSTSIANEVKLNETEMIAMAKERLASMSKAETKEFKREVKKALRESNATTNVVEIILAILLPPLGVYLHEGDINSRFWISLLLTLLFFIPGVIYALLVVTDTI